MATVALIGLVLTPSVQRWAVLKATRDVPGLNLEMESVQAGLSGVKLTGVRAVAEGVPVKLDKLEADFSLIGLVLGRQLELRRVAITGLHVDASHLSRARAEAAAAGAPAAAPGLLGQLELPFDLVMDNVRIEGQALLPGAVGQPPIEAQYTLTGGGFAAGREGTLALGANLNNPAPGAKVSTLRARADLRATLTAQRTFSRVSLNTVVDAQGAALADQAQLKVGAELYGTSAGENYEVTVSTLLHGTAENLLIVQARLPSASDAYVGDWDLKVRTAQLEPFVLGGSLPEFDARGGGHFSFNAAAGSFALQGALEGKVSRLELIEPAWRTFGNLAIDANFDLGQQDGVLDLRAFKATVAGDKPVLAIQATAPIRYDLGKNALLPQTSVTDALLNVTIQGLPIDWIRPFVTAADISGGLITGQLEVVRTSPQATDATVRGELTLAELNVVQEGRSWLSKAAISARGEASFAGGTVTVPGFELEARTPVGDTLALSGRLATGLAPDAPMAVGTRFSFSSPKLLERWLPGAPVTGQGEIDVTVRGDLLEVRPGRVELRQGAGRALLDATIVQGFSFNLATHALVPAGAEPTIMRLALGRLPLSTLPLTEPGTAVGGYVQQADFDLGISAGKITFGATSPLRLADVSLTRDRQPSLTGLAIEARPVLDYLGRGNLKIRTGEVTVRNAARASVVTLQLEATQSPGQDAQAVLEFALEVPALATQPLFAGAQAVSSGRATGEMRASLGTLSQMEARVTLNGLVSAVDGLTLPVANIGFRARVQPNGAASLRVPVLLDNAGRRSDLDFSIELSPLGQGYSLDGRLGGQQVELEDLLGVLSVFTASAAPESADKPVAAASVPPDTTAVWDRFSGRLGLDIKSVTRGETWAMTDLTGTLAIEPSLVTLQKLEASFGDTSRLDAKMDLRFTGGSMPYRLTGEYALNDFDTGRLFRAIDPSKPPTVEGLFNIAGRIAGNGETIGRAMERAQGDFQLTSRGGIFRGLQRSSSKLSMTSKAVELGASVLGSLLGSDKATKTAEKVAGQAYFVDQLAQGIGEFKYDLLSVRLARDELLNMNLEDISLVSPEIRLNGQGSVTYVVGRPLLEQPFSARLSFAARGKIEQLFAKARLLDGTKDELGYSRTKEAVTLGGTLAKPDPTAFFTKIAQSKLADFLDMDN